MKLTVRITTLVCIVFPTIACGQNADGSQPSIRNNAACWNYLSNSEVRPDITCTPLSIDLLAKLRFATKQQIEAVMKEPGRLLGDGTIRYISNYDYGSSSGTGSVDFSFDHDGRTIIIDAEIDVPSQAGNPANADYLWNADRKFFCSDIPIGVPARN